MKTFICNISNKLASEQEIVLKEKLEENFGSFKEIKKADTWYAPIEYTEEMGGGLETVLYIFESQKTDTEIQTLKAFCVSLEKETSQGDKRVFNLNPGFISQEGMFLISHKPSEKRGRTPFGDYWVEKQYDINEKGEYAINNNTFSEYKMYLEDLEKII